MIYFQRLLTAKAHSLRLPTDMREDVDRFVRRHQPGGGDPERMPFRRRLDLWAYSVATAVAQGMEPVSAGDARKGYKFKDTASVRMAPELCVLLAVAAAVATEVESSETASAGSIIEFGNRLAAAGCPLVIEKLREVDLRLTPLARVHAYARSLLSDRERGSSVVCGGSPNQSPTAGC